MERLRDKVVLITGAGSGIGRATAYRFAAEGAYVVIQDLDIEAAEETAGGLEGQHTVLGGDVSDEEQMAAVFECIKTDLGRLDVLVNNAGVGQMPGDDLVRPSGLSGLVTQGMSYESFMGMLAVHVGGAFLCSRASVPLMKNGGSIVNLSSIAGLAGWGRVHYSAAKGAILGLTRSLARELASLTIRVNAVAPGLVDTPLTADFPKERMNQLLAVTPLGRIGEPTEIAATVLFLASEDSGFVTGQWVSPNGGFVIS